MYAYGSPVWRWLYIVFICLHPTVNRFLGRDNEDLLYCIVSVTAAHVFAVADEHAPELALRPAYLSTFSHMTDQASKMGIGNNQSIIAFYDNLQVATLSRNSDTVVYAAMTLT